MKVTKFIELYTRVNPIAFALLFIGALTGCSASPQSPQITQPIVQPMTYREPPANYANPGSIYSGNTYRSLYEDGRARRVGDIVTINIMENSSASQSATTSTKRESNVDTSASAFLGFGSLFNIPIGGDQPLIGMANVSDFEGDGSTSRDNSISATLAARVINVLSDGNMQIEAVREIKVNNETQFMVVSGIVRTRDISTANTIPSTQIANARIEYFGQGVVSAQQQPGWLIRFIDAISPF